MKILITSLVIVLVGIFGVYQANASGISIDWTGDDLIKKEAVFTDDMNSTFGICRNVDSIDIVSDLEYMNGATLKSRGCVVEGKDVDMYVSSSVDIDSDNPRNFAIRIKPSGKFYFLKPGAIANAQYANLISETNMYIEWRNTYYERKLVRAMDIRGAIRADRFDSTGNPIRYTFDDSSASVDTYAFTNIDQTISAGPITKDGKFVFWSGYGWLYKMDIEVGVLDIKYMPGWDVNWQNTPYYSNQIYPVDSEGRYVYLGGKLDMLIDTVNCGQYYETVDHMGVPEQVLAEQTNCKMKSFKGLISSDTATNQHVFGANIQGYTLQFGVWLYDESPARKMLAEFSPVGIDIENLPKLAYLALGDSYSSGEGDNGIFFGKKHYREWTDDNGPPREKCHISTRSYPYLLANTQGLERNDWNVVACSGALVEKDYHGDGASYLGQGGRLSNLGSRLPQYRTNAINDFIPGRVKQVEFVKQYKPRVITVTGTGNDVGFSDILAACVDALHPDETCTYAGDSRGKSMLGRAIQKQYDSVRKLARGLREASPESTVYYVGYPQFLKETDKRCGLGVSLSIDERKVMRAATTYLNRIIKAASESEGAVYIDIENSLGSHLLCGGDPYVTGYNADCDPGILNWFKAKDECQESFHPKPVGHILIASAILAKHPNIMQDKPCAAPRSCSVVTNLGDVEVPKIFKDAYGQDAKANREPVRGGTELAAQKGNANASIHATASNVEPNGKFDTYVTSDPVNLGEVRSDSEGNLVIDKVVPESLPAGYHTLHVEGNDSSGKPIELWWIIRIFGRDGDVDEDGISDSVDKCMFMPTLNIDEDNDGIDDGCDSDIGGSGRWSQYTPSLNRGAAITGTTKNSPLSNNLLAASAPENFADGGQSWIRSAVGNENSAKFSGSRNNRADKSTISMIMIGIGLFSVLFIAYTIIRKGGINGKKATNQ